MRFIFALLLLPVFFVACGDDTPDVSEEDAVRNTFAYYKRAILAESGAEAFQWVDRTTADFYSRILSLAADADSATVRSLDLQDRYMVFLIRHSIPAEQVRRMDGGALFAYAVQEGLLGETRMADMEIGDVAVNGTTATGSLLVKGKPSGLEFRFNKEGGLWKIDLTSLFPQSEAALRNHVVQSGRSEDEFVDEMIELQTGVKPGADVWRPVDSGVVR